MEETTDKLRARYWGAFRSYAAQAAKMRALSTKGAAEPGDNSVDLLNDQLTLVMRAENIYRSVRLEYALRLLSEQGQA